MQYDDDASNEMNNESEEEIQIKFKSPVIQKSRKGSEDICLNVSSSNPALKEMHTIYEDTKSNIAKTGIMPQNSHFSLKKENNVSQMFSMKNGVGYSATNAHNNDFYSWKNLKKSSNKLLAREAQRNDQNEFDIFDNLKELQRKSSKISEYDDKQVNELWKEGWLARNLVYNFTINENESKFKTISQRSIHNH